MSDIQDIINQGKKEKIENLKVSADPKDITPEERKRCAKKLAGAIGHGLRTNGEINVRSFGRECVYKAVKSLAIARSYIRATNPNLELSYSPAFIEAQVDNGTMKGICFYTFVQERQPNEVEKDLSKVEIVLKVTADDEGISSEKRNERLRKLAGAITHAVTEKRECVVRAFGKRAVSKAVRALAIARGFTATKGPDLYAWNDFAMADMQGSAKTGFSFYAYTNIA